MTLGLATAGPLLMIFFVAINRFVQQILAFSVAQCPGPRRDSIYTDRAGIQASLLCTRPRRIFADVIFKAESRLEKSFPEV